MPTNIMLVRGINQIVKTKYGCLDFFNYTTIYHLKIRKNQFSFLFKKKFAICSYAVFSNRDDKIKNQEMWVKNKQKSREVQ